MISIYGVQKFAPPLGGMAAKCFAENTKMNYSFKSITFKHATRIHLRLTESTIPSIPLFNIRTLGKKNTISLQYRSRPSVSSGTRLTCNLLSLRHLTLSVNKNNYQFLILRLPNSNCFQDIGDGKSLSTNPNIS